MALDPVKIFYSDGKILFEADKRTIEPKFTGTLVASLVETDRIKIERTDRQRPDGSNRVVFRRMRATRVLNESAQSLIDELSYTPQQVMDYLNNEFNRSNVDELNESTFVEYDIYANVEYAGLFGVSDGSALRPYPTIQSAVDSAEDGDNIFLKGDFQLTAEVLLPADKSLHFFGRDTTQWCYASYDAANGKLVNQSSSSSTAKYSFHGIRFINAGDYAMYIRSANEVTVQDCEFLRNGWSGNGLSCTDSATGSTLGFDSPQGDLQAFAAGSEISDGGAMLIRSTPVVNITDSSVHSGRRGVIVQDCGIGGAGIIARNRMFNNIESGVYLAAATDGAAEASGDGCENFTVYNNFNSNNSSNGVLVVGGSNNIISLNRVEGNWNAGVMLKSVSDTRARDMDLDNNNRSEFNGLGEVGDAKASIQIDGQYMRSDATFLAEILDTTVHNTGLGSSTTTNGLLIGSSVGTISGAVVNIDDVGFVSQDYAINLSEVDVSNITLSLGDCRYQDIAQAAVLSPIAGNYNELPFSNHVTSALQVDVVLDTLRQMVSLTEGVGGNVINTYKINELQSVINGSAVDLIQKQTDKIQLRGCTLNNTFVDGVVAGNTVASMNDTLNAAFGMDLTQYKEYLVSTVGVNGDSQTWYYIESPDGVFTYPLFAGSDEANSVDTAQGGAGSSNGYSFPDEPTSSTWYGPVTDITTNGTVAPSHGTWGTFTDIIWNEIATDADSTVAPTPFSDASIQIDEGSALNSQIHPAGATFTTTIQSPPAWITQATDNANVTGTAPAVSGDNVNFPSESYTVTVVRTNTYGASTGTLTVVVNNLTAPASLPGTLHAGSVIASSATNSSGKIYLQVTGGHLVYDIDTLEDGDKIEWYHQDGTYGFGIAASGVDKTTDLVSSAVDNSALWDLLAPITGSPTHTNGQNFGEGFSGSHPGLVPLGWDDNTNPQVIPTRPIYPASDVWKLYNNAGTIELSLNGTLFRSSSSTHTDPVITFAMNEQSGEGGVAEFSEFPTFTHTANAASAPSGFTLEHGTMDTSSLLSTDSVVSLDNLTVSPGQRLVVNKSWADTYVLPNIDGTNGLEDNKVFLGLPKTGFATWGDIGLTQDFWAAHRWENQGANATLMTSRHAGASPTEFNVTHASDTSSNNHFAIDFSREGHLSILRSTDTNPSLTTEPVGGTFGASATWTDAYSTTGSGALDIVMAAKGGGQVALSTSGVSVITSPIPANQFDVTEDTFSLPLFNGDPAADVTLAAGSTYKFWLHSTSIESTDALGVCLISDNSDYTTGVTVVGTPGSFGSYVEFAIPADVPPVKFKWTSGGVAYYTTPGISGSTYSAGVTGITLEGPSANQSGTEIVSTTSGHGWVSIDETLGAGERLVLDGAFFADLLAETPNNYDIAIGLKGDNWANTQYTGGSNAITTGMFKGDAYLNIRKSTTSTTYWQIFTAFGSSNSMLTNSSSLVGTVGAFIEVTGSGNNIRLAFGRNGSAGFVTGDESTKRYGDWTSYKAQTGEQGYGITNLDVMVGVNAVFSATTFDGDEVDWTGLSEVSIPTAPVITTDWDKAVDFSGSNEHLVQVSTSNVYNNALRMGGLATTIAANTDSSKTSSSSSARPWATSIVFKSDGNNSNQHIWNCGEGTASGDDNIFLRVSASGQLIFAWGREGSGYNDITVATNISSSTWYGVYIAHKGTRLSAGNASAANVADCFDIRMMSSADSFAALGSNLSTSGNVGSSGARMDRGISEDFTVGGRGTNRNFHGKVASMVLTTLKVNNSMPTDAEIKLMITDPKKWEDDYRDGQQVRNVHNGSNATYLSSIFAGYGATQIWLMGDGTIDAYNTGIRNQVQPNEQNYGKMQFNSMQSNDVETVTIPGLT